MQQLAQGSEFPDTGLTVPGSPRGLPVVVGPVVGQVPHGDQYRGRHGDRELMLTLVDPALWSQADARAWLLRNAARVQQVEHRSLLACYGAVVGGPSALIVHAWPGGFSGRQLLAERSNRGRAVDLATAHVLIGHVCNALTALHEVMVHGYVTLDSIWVSANGRVLLGEASIGPLLTRARRFERWRNSGRLPNVAPEQIVSPPQLSPATDVFAVAATMLELLTGRPLSSAGQPMPALGLWGPIEIIDVLERATAVEPGDRQADVQTFKAELSEAVAGLDSVDLRPVAEGHANFAVTAGPDSGVGVVIPPLAESGGTPPSPLASIAPPPAFGTGIPAATPPGPVGVPVPVPTTIPGMGPMGVIGVPVAGPDGRPTVVSMLVPLTGTPASTPPIVPPPPQPRATAKLPDTQAMADLERATRRIADAADAEAMELTEDVSQSSTRLAGLELPGGASASNLRLDVDHLADAARRLQTLDGSPATELQGGTDEGRRHVGGRAQLADLDARAKAAHPGGTRARTPVAIDADDLEPDAPRSYRLLRHGRDDTDHSMTELVEFARTGKLIGTDVIVHLATGRRLRVFDVGELRQALTGNASAPPRAAGAPSAPPSRPASAPPSRTASSSSGSLTPPPIAAPASTPATVTPSPVSPATASRSSQDLAGIPAMERSRTTATPFGARLELDRRSPPPAPTAPMLLATSGTSGIRWILVALGLAAVVGLTTWIFVGGSP